MKRTRCKIAALSLGLTVLASPGFAGTKYNITDLGAGVIPSAINKSGHIVGTIVVPGSAPEAFIYREGIVKGLGQLGGTASWGLGINDSAGIVGSICLDEVCTKIPYAGKREGFLAVEGKVTNLMSAAGMVAGFRINNSGLILGDGILDGRREVILYDSKKGTATNISEGLDQYTIPPRPRALNNLGDAVFTESYCSTCFVTAYLFRGGTLRALPQDVYAWEVSDINDKGQIVGDTGYDNRGFVYSQDLTILRDDIHGVHFGPEAINNQGVMVGRAGTSEMRLFRKKPMWHKPVDQLPFEPAIFAKGKITLLQAQLAKTDDQWKLEEVFDINDKGQIIGYGSKNGDMEHGFLLTPANMKVREVP